ncbi:hypothetical protein [Pedobacter zeae]|uniref:Uncharacterized protein n=1 Tax=Pedobacter zeae TaxID=1737356 RepID=A0A7W6P5D3_9SPHI|nr:hypothetical protein [Pedobacter zeae]MBB4107708.1 hypothetical protein [Pedobacter zeae]GGG97583.1 hypothetical protein GCM10007422_09440 [Pedobacter zeae]
MDLFSQLPDYNPPTHKAKNEAKPVKKENLQPIKQAIKIPSKGEAILLEDIVSNVVVKNGLPLIYAKAGDVCKVIANANGPLVVLESEHTGRFHVRSKQVIIHQ